MEVQQRYTPTLHMFDLDAPMAISLLDPQRVWVFLCLQFNARVSYCVSHSFILEPF